MKSHVVQKIAVAGTLCAVAGLLPACTRAADAPKPAAPAMAAETAASGGADLHIKAAVLARLNNDKQLTGLGIHVEATNRRVVLRGATPNTAARVQAARLAGEVPGVAQVDNELSVQPRAR